jgi:hypothetical protein
MPLGLNRKRLALTAAVIGAVCMASPAWADSAADEAIRQAQGCSTEKAIRYSRQTTELAKTIAEAAFDACQSLWQEVVNKWQAATITPNGTPFTDQQLRSNPWLMSTSLAIQAADRERNGLPGRREAEIKRLQVLVLETRTAPKK